MKCFNQLVKHFVIRHVILIMEDAQLIRPVHYNRFSVLELRVLQWYSVVSHDAYSSGCVTINPRTETECPIEGQVFTTCGTACPPTCNNPGPLICTLQCVVGCQCPPGTVLDEKNKKCVKPEQCG